MIQEADWARRFLSEPRFKAYLDFVSACTDISDISAAALALYRWNTEISSVVMGYVSYIEVLVRNAIDDKLRSWISKQRVTGYDDWIDVYCADPLGRIRHLINGDGSDHLSEAMQDALRKQRQWKSDATHPRHGDAINRNDVFTQLSFGAWDSMLKRSDDDQELASVLMSAFPNIEVAWSVEQVRMPHAVLPGNLSDDRQRRLRLELVRRLQRIRKVRNRAGHQENLLRVDFPTLRRDMLFVLSALGPSCLHWALPDRAVRLKEADPYAVIANFRKTSDTSKKERG